MNTEQTNAINGTRPPMRGEDIISRGRPRTLPCKLSRDELLDIAIQRSKNEILRAQCKADLESEVKKRKQQIEEQTDVIDLQGRELACGEQDRPVPCDSIFRDGMVYVRRMDTYEEFEHRPATPSEAQRYFPAVEHGTSSGNGLLDRATAAQASEVPGDNDEVGSTYDGPLPGDDVYAGAQDDGDDDSDAPFGVTEEETDSVSLDKPKAKAAKKSKAKKS